MRTLILSLFVLFIAAPNANAQLATIADSFNQTEEHFNTIEKQTSFSAVFTEAEMDLMKEPKEGSLIFCNNCKEGVGFYLYFEENWNNINSKSVVVSNCDDYNFREE